MTELDESLCGVCGKPVLHNQPSVGVNQRMSAAATMGQSPRRYYHSECCPITVPGIATLVAPSADEQAACPEPAEEAVGAMGNYLKVSPEPRYARWIFVRHIDGVNWTTCAQMTQETWDMLQLMLARDTRPRAAGKESASTIGDIKPVKVNYSLHATDFKGYHVFGGSFDTGPHCIYCGMWRGDDNLPEKCSGDATAPAGQVAQGATPLTDTIVSGLQNMLDRRRNSNNLHELFGQAQATLVQHARDLERRLAEANSALAHAGAAHAGMREWKQLADDYKQKWLGAIDTLIVVGKAKEQAEAKLSQRPDQQEVVERLLKSAWERMDTARKNLTTGDQHPERNWSMLDTTEDRRAAAAALSKEGK